MAPERKLYQKLKKNITTISWIRLENLSLSGTPDLLGYNNSGHFFTVELKVTKSNKVRLSPHQIAFHVRHPNNSFILVESLDQRCLKLFPGSKVQELAACGLALEPLCLGLDACRLRFEELGAWSLLLEASSISLCGTVSSITCWRPESGARLADAVATLGLMTWSEFEIGAASRTQGWALPISLLRLRNSL